MDRITRRDSTSSTGDVAPSTNCRHDGSNRTFINDLWSLTYWMSRFVDAISGPRIRWFFGVPLRTQTYLNLLYLSLAFPLGLAYLVVAYVGLVVVAVPLLIGWGSVPGVFVGVLASLVVAAGVLACGLAGALVVSSLESRLTTLLLGVEIETGRLPDEESVGRSIRSLLTDLGTWKPLVYLPSKFLFGVVTLALLVTALPTGVSMVTFPLYYHQPGLYVGLVTERPLELHRTLYLGWHNLLVGFEAVLTRSWWEVTTLTEALMAAGAGIVLSLGTLHAVNGLARLAGWYTRTMLRGTFDVAGVVHSHLDV